jgi:hypothetical protein
VLSSCKKDLTSIIGGDLQPPGEYIFAGFDNTSVSLIAYTIPDTRGITRNRNFYGLGSYNNETFGRVKMDLITQIYEANRDTIPDVITSVDSILLMLVYHSAYPFTAIEDIEPFTISIGELEEGIRVEIADTLSLYSDVSLPQKDGGGTILRNWDVKPEFRDSIDVIVPRDSIEDPNNPGVMINNDTTERIRVSTHVLRIPLHAEDNENEDGLDFAKRLLNTSYETAKLENNRENTFLETITGLYIESHMEQNPNSGNIVNFDWSGRDGAVPGILVYYTTPKPDTTSTGEDTIVNVSRVKTYTIGTGFWDAIAYNYIEFDRTMASPNLTQQLDTNNSEENRIALGDEMVFLQSFFGTLFRVRMPNIRDFTTNLHESGKIDTNLHRIAINEARLVMSTSPNKHLPDGVFAPTLSLDVRHYVTPDSVVPIRDHSSVAGGVSGGGSYNSTKEEYRIFLTRHVQHLLLNSEEDAPNFELTIRSNNRFAVPDITSIFGPNPKDPKDQNKRMRLDIVYTGLPK